MQEDQTHGPGLLFKSTVKPKRRNIPGPSSSGLLKVINNVYLFCFK